MNVSLNIFRNFVAQLSKFGFGMANWRVAINSKFTWTCLKFAFSLFVLPLFALNLCTGSTLMFFSMPTLSFKIYVTFSAHISVSLMQLHKLCSPLVPKYSCYHISGQKITCQRPKFLKLRNWQIHVIGYEFSGVTIQRCHSLVD